MFIEGNKIEYNGQRDKDSFIQFIKKRTQPKSLLLNSADEVKEIAQGHFSVFYFGETDDKFHQTYLSVSGQMDDDINFYHASEEIGKEAFPDEEFNYVVLTRDFESPIIPYKGEDSKDELSNFITKFSIPLIKGFDQKIAQKMFGEGTPGIFYFRKEQKQDFAPEYRELATKLAVIIKKTFHDLFFY